MSTSMVLLYDDSEPLRHLRYALDLVLSPSGSVSSLDSGDTLTAGKNRLSRVLVRTRLKSCGSTTVTDNDGLSVA